MATLDTITSEIETGFDPELMFTHPDKTENLDQLDDPVTEVSEALYAIGPVLRGQGLNGGTSLKFGDHIFPNILVPPHLCDDDIYLVTSYEAHKQMYMNAKVFSSTLFEESVGAFWGPALTPMDPPEHTKYRKIMQLAFMPRQIKGYEDDVVRPVLERRFNELKPNGKADLVRDINAYYPYEIVGRIVGFEPEDVEFVGHCFFQIWQAAVNPQAAMQAGIDLRAYTQKLIDRRRANPKEDLVSAILQAEVDGESLPNDRLVGMVNHLMAGGVDTTYRQTGNLLHCLLTYPDQFEKMRQNRELIPNAISEALRFEGLGGITARQSKQDFELMGVTIPKDKVVFTMHPVANRDPERWSNPHEFDIERDVEAHMQFASGPHSCIGQHLARLMMSHYLELLLDTMPNLRLDPALSGIPRITGWTQRAVLSLPVVWDT